MRPFDHRRSTGRRPRARARWRGGWREHFGARPSRHRHALPRRRPLQLARVRRRSGRSRRPRRRPRDAVDPARSRRPAAARASAVAAALPRWSRRSRRCARRCWRFQRDFAATTRRAGDAGARCSTAATSAPWSAPMPTVKLFVTASPEARAARRFKELRAARRGGYIRARPAGHEGTRRARQRASGGSA